MATTQSGNFATLTLVSSSGRFAADRVSTLMVTLSDSQIKAMPTSDFTLLAAQGANTIIQTKWVHFLLDTRSGAYTNISSSTPYIATAINGVKLNYVANDSSGVSSPFTTPVTAFTDSFGTARLSNIVMAPPSMDFNPQWGILPRIYASSSTVNKALVLTMNNSSRGALTGGSSNNTLTVRMDYLVMASPSTS